MCVHVVTVHVYIGLVVVHGGGSLVYIGSVGGVAGSVSPASATPGPGDTLVYTCITGSCLGHPGPPWPALGHPGPPWPTMGHPGGG